MNGKYTVDSAVLEQHRSLPAGELSLTNGTVRLGQV